MKKIVSTKLRDAAKKFEKLRFELIEPEERIFNLKEFDNFPLRIRREYYEFLLVVFKKRKKKYGNIAEKKIKELEKKAKDELNGHMRGLDQSLETGNLKDEINLKKRRFARFKNEIPDSHFSYYSPHGGDLGRILESDVSPKLKIKKITSEVEIPQSDSKPIFFKTQIQFLFQLIVKNGRIYNSWDDLDIPKSRLLSFLLAVTRGIEEKFQSYELMILDPYDFISRLVKTAQKAWMRWREYKRDSGPIGLYDEDTPRRISWNRRVEILRSELS